MVSLKKAWSVLEIGGYMCININDIRGHPTFVHRMIRDVNTYLDSIYLGPISYSKIDKDKIVSPQPVWCWRKSTSFEIDPKLRVEKITYKNKNFNIIQEGYMPGGSKQRMYKAFDIKQDYFVYAGPSTGLAQVAMGLIGKYWKKYPIMFTYSITSLTVRALQYGVRVVLKSAGLKELQDISTKYAKELNAYLCPFGFDSPQLRKALTDNVKKNSDFTPSRLWTAIGSATLINSLYKVWDIKYFGVQVGRKVWPDMINDKTKLFISPKKFTEDTWAPYPTIYNYDGKTWDFAQNGMSGDYIWTVGTSYVLTDGEPSEWYKKWLIIKRLGLSKNYLMLAVNLGGILKPLPSSSSIWKFVKDPANTKKILLEKYPVPKVQKNTVGTQVCVNEMRYTLDPYHFNLFKDDPDIYNLAIRYDCLGVKMNRYISIYKKLYELGARIDALSSPLTVPEGFKFCSPYAEDKNSLGSFFKVELSEPFVLRPPCILIDKALERAKTMKLNCFCILPKKYLMGKLIFELEDAVVFEL
jgi:hypothetical protein